MKFTESLQSNQQETPIIKRLQQELQQKNDELQKNDADHKRELETIQNLIEECRAELQRNCSKEMTSSKKELQQQIQQKDDELNKRGKLTMKGS